MTPITVPCPTCSSTGTDTPAHKAGGEEGKTAFDAYWQTPNARWDQMSDLGKAKWAQAESKILVALSQAPAVQAPAGWPASYQETFDAIGKAVTIHPDGMLGISVKAFYGALAYPDAPAQPTAVRPVGDEALREVVETSDQIFDRLRIEHMVREWCQPLSKGPPGANFVDGLIGVLRLRFKRIDPAYRDTSKAARAAWLAVAEARGITEDWTPASHSKEPRS